MRGIVVVGNGMAGSRLVSEVRARDKKARITVFGAEERAPYNRVLLSNVLAGTTRADQVRLHAPPGTPTTTSPPTWAPRSSGSTGRPGAC